MASHAETDPLERWHSTEPEVPFDQELCGSILEFIAVNYVKSIAMSPGILGCPQEEGVDYPMRQKRQACPKLGKRRSLDGRGHRVNRTSSNPRLQRTRAARPPMSRREAAMRMYK